MKLFGQLVNTLVNVATLPVAVVKDVFTLGGVATGNDGSYTAEQMQRIKDEAQDDSADEGE
jgi:hypothetical protein